MSSPLNTIAVAGGFGFIGAHLVTALLRAGNRRIKVLSRFSRTELTRIPFPEEVEVIQGDLLDSASLKNFLEPGCTVINLVYLASEGEAGNLLAIGNLLAACSAAKVGRLIHCSTADVVGRTPHRRVVESTPCRPVTAYARAKLKVESAIVETDSCYDIGILRPTAVFGPGGQNLKKLAQDLVMERRLGNALKACLFGHRRMNLVHVENVTAAIIFLTDHSGALRKEIFIVSDDDAPSNNFASVERAMIQGLGIKGPTSRRISFPPWILSLLLRVLCKNNVNPLCIYDAGKLHSLGFRKPVSFEEGLSRYIAWYRSVSLDGAGKTDS